MKELFNMKVWAARDLKPYDDFASIYVEEPDWNKRYGDWRGDDRFFTKRKLGLRPGQKRELELVLREVE